MIFSSLSSSESSYLLAILFFESGESGKRKFSDGTLPEGDTQSY